MDFKVIAFHSQEEEAPEKYEIRLIDPISVFPSFVSIVIPCNLVQRLIHCKIEDRADRNNNKK